MSGEPLDLDALLVRPSKPEQDVDFGDPRLPDRIWARLEESQERGCWVWTGVLLDGYGQVSFESRKWLLHRLSYSVFVAPTDLQVDHLCRVTACMRPSHLEAVTNRQNTLRGSAPIVNSNQETCRNGLHPWIDSNIRYLPDGSRRCAECRRALQRRAYVKSRSVA